MALEAVVNSQDPFGHLCKEFYATLGGGGGGASGWSYHDDFNILQGEDKALVRILDNSLDHGRCGTNWEYSSPDPSVILQSVRNCWDPDSSPEACTGGQGSQIPAVSCRRKRRRTKSCKNKEELENQRMTHIAVERNRRKQMNEYLAVIRSLMPASYVQRGDQASIIGGAINFVKELEQLLQTLEAQKRTATRQPPPHSNGSSSPLFADFFAFPQYSTRPTTATDKETPADTRLAFADIEVTMVESHANLKILSKRRPRQLLNMVAGLQCLRFTVLHLNVTTLDQMVLYSLSIKIEEGCQLTTVDEIADAVNHLLGRFEEEAAAAGRF